MQLKKTKILRMGATKTLGRAEAIQQYVILRMRFEEIRRLDYLLKALRDTRIALPDNSPFSSADLADTVRTCFLGWLATLMDGDDRAIYAFNSLFVLYPNRKAEIVKAQISLGACNSELQQFRNNVAFHATAEIEAHIQARRNFKDEDVYLDLVSAINDFQHLMEVLIAEERTAIPELPSVLEQMHVSHLPAFSVKSVPPERRASGKSS